MTNHTNHNRLREQRSFLLKTKNWDDWYNIYTEESNGMHLVHFEFRFGAAWVKYTGFYFWKCPLKKWRSNGEFICKIRTIYGLVSIEAVSRIIDVPCVFDYGFHYQSLWSLFLIMFDKYQRGYTSFLLYLPWLVKASRSLVFVRSTLWGEAGKKHAFNMNYAK